MAKTRELVQRRKAVTNIRKITRTMELIATSRFKKAMDRASEAAAYTRKIAELAADLSATSADIKHPLLEIRESVKNVRLLVISANRGLCGGYNASINREANGQIRRMRTASVVPRLDVSGKRGINYFRQIGFAPEHAFLQFEDKPKFDEVDVIADRYIQEYVSGAVDRVDVVYTQFISAVRQTVTCETLLPLAPVSSKPKSASIVEYEFLPAPAEILEQILPESFKVRLFKCFLDAAVSEQIARRVAMKAATDAAGDMIKELSRKYNRARQAQITKEIAEIVGGAEALK